MACQPNQYCAWTSTVLIRLNPGTRQGLAVKWWVCKTTKFSNAEVRVRTPTTNRQGGDDLEAYLNVEQPVQQNLNINYNYMNPTYQN
jgi:hypothetical protein